MGCVVPLLISPEINLLMLGVWGLPLPVASFRDVTAAIVELSIDLGLVESGCYNTKVVR